MIKLWSRCCLLFISRISISCCHDIISSSCCPQCGQRQRFTLKLIHTRIHHSVTDTHNNISSHTIFLTHWIYTFLNGLLLPLIFLMLRSKLQVQIHRYRKTEQHGGKYTSNHSDLWLLLYVSWPVKRFQTNRNTLADVLGAVFFVQTAPKRRHFAPKNLTLKIWSLSSQVRIMHEKI